jgi:hypothetical protein
MSDVPTSIQFFDPRHGLHCSARAGATLLFEGAGSRVLADGPRVERAGRGWRARLEGELELELEPIAPAAELHGVTAHVCDVRGRVGERELRCLGTFAETHVAPEWDRLDALRSISALFDRDNALLAIAQRPQGAVGHGVERNAAWLLRDGEPVEIEELRLSTVYDGDGRQRSAGVELWLADEEHPLRASGTVVAGSSLQLEGIEVHAAVFRWRMGEREGAGAYELMSRSELLAA